MDPTAPWLEGDDPPVHRTLGEGACASPSDVAPGAFVVLSLRGERNGAGRWLPYDLPPGIALVGVGASSPRSACGGLTEHRIELLVAGDLASGDYAVVMAYRADAHLTPVRTLKFVLRVCEA